MSNTKYDGDRMIAIPRRFFEGENEYSDMSFKAKMLYTTLININAIKSGCLQVDENGISFVRCSNFDLAKILGTSEGSINRAKKELLEFCLIKISKKDIGCANRIYVGRLNPND